MKHIDDIKFITRVHAFEKVPKSAGTGLAIGISTSVGVVAIVTIGFCIYKNKSEGENFETLITNADSKDDTKDEGGSRFILTKV